RFVEKAAAISIENQVGDLKHTLLDFENYGVAKLPDAAISAPISNTKQKTESPCPAPFPS
ncbi:MAG: hypothetical protein ACXU8U_03635, partial [Asticcacaulis sp.]